MSPLGASLYSNGARYFVVPDTALPAPGPVWMTDVTGRELSLDPAAAAAFEVDEAGADAFVAAEVDAVIPKLVGGVVGILAEAAAAPLAERVQVALGLLDTLRAATTGDAEGLARFALRCRRVAETLEARGDPALGAAVRALPERVRALGPAR